MSKTHRHRIAIKTREVKIIRIRGDKLSGHCSKCDSTVTVFAAEQIAEAISSDVFEKRDIHVVENEGGLRLICANSIRRIYDELKFITSRNQD